MSDLTSSGQDAARQRAETVLERVQMSDMTPRNLDVTDINRLAADAAESYSGTPECRVCDFLRQRIHDLEEAAEAYIDVVTETGERRVAAMARLQAALATNFRGAVLSSRDMTPEQRAHWLAGGDGHE